METLKGLIVGLGITMALTGFLVAWAAWPALKSEWAYRKRLRQLDRLRRGHR